MTVSELKENLNCNIKLGSKNGAAFVWCGNIRDFDPDELEQDLTKKLTRLLKNADRAAHKQERITPNWDNYLKRCARYEEEPTKTGYKRWVEKTKKDLIRKTNYAEKLQDRFENWPHIRNREVVEIYKSVAEENTVIVLMEGSETGRYWTTEEFLHGVSDEDEK